MANTATKRRRKTGKSRKQMSFVSLMSGKAVTRFLEGREYWVIPGTIIVEGVLTGNGAPGPIYYPRKVIRRHDMAWNHKPIVVYHPEDEDGNFASADDVDVMNYSKVGHLSKTNTRNGKERAEFWIEKSRARAVDPRIEKAIKSGIKMEVSTGLKAELRQKRGIFNGKRYEYIVETIFADHLALLPDQIGACSLKDGCGLFQFNRALPFKGAKRIQSVLGKILSNGDKSMKCITRKQKMLVANKLIKAGGEFKASDQKFLVSLDGKHLSKLYRLSQNQRDPDEDEDDEDEQKARTKKSLANKKKQLLRNKKKKIVKKKVSNKDPEDDDDEDEAPARKLKNKTGCTCKTANKKKALANRKKRELNPLQQFIKASKMPREYADLLNNLVTENKEIKEELIEAILNNEANQFEEDELENFSMKQLKKLYAAMPKDEDEEDENTSAKLANYIGRSGISNHADEDEDEEENNQVLSMPSTLISNSDDDDEDEEGLKKKKKKQTA